MPLDPGWTATGINVVAIVPAARAWSTMRMPLRRNRRSASLFLDLRHGILHVMQPSQMCVEREICHESNIIS